ncbi:NADH dehydrogenase ubiquinone Fe-S protein 4 [Bradyrhizobium australiense]|uniref:NADH dehydrogenase ubiquinone Fe-S protein 4 n=1 Tax=Bradyrhizobium australiense TaxID=2721161 RepID=UPI001F314883|nr:NADH dehydrogenase ubiquinone Fe-S protein 4 [Bradyrhizobium australiense]
MSSGKARTKGWRLTFERRSAPYVEPLIGWTGDDDPLATVELSFPTLRSAIRYAEGQRLPYVVEATEEQNANQRQSRKMKHAFSDETSNALPGFLAKACRRTAAPRASTRWSLPRWRSSAAAHRRKAPRGRRHKRLKPSRRERYGYPCRDRTDAVFAGPQPASTKSGGAGLAVEAAGAAPLHRHAADGDRLSSNPRRNNLQAATFCETPPG